MKTTSIPLIEQRLKRIGWSLLQWRAMIVLAWGGAALLALLLLLALADFFFRMNVAGRVSAAILMLGLAIVLAWRLCRTLGKKLSADGIAALIEKACPELDNRLINYVQFARGAQTDPFKAAYVSVGPPDLRMLDYSRIKNRRAQLRGLLVLMLSAALLFLPSFFVGRAWTVSVLRIINPLARIQPVTLTHILDIEPGNAVIRQGDNVLLTVRVDGYPGHKVALDVQPADAARATYNLGQISQAGAQRFTHSLQRVNTDTRYRFRAGDASPSEWHTISARPPPAFSRIVIEVVAPEYTRQAPKLLDARNDELVIPFGALVKLSVTSSEGIRSVKAQPPNSETMDLVQNQEGNWLGSFFLTEPGPITVAGEDEFGSSLTEEINCRVQPDQPPSIDIITPIGRAILPPGETPRIAFHVSDDYGLAEVAVEQIEPDQTEHVPGVVLQTWSIGDSREFREAWIDPRPVGTNQSLAFRITASDNNPFNKNLSSSSPIIFNAPTEEELADSQAQLEKQAISRLSELIEIQKANIIQTRSLGQTPSASAGETWSAVIERQKLVRSLTGELLRNPIRPLGGKTEVVNRLFLNEMVLAVEALETAAASDETARGASVDEALHLQEAILRGLMAADVAAARAAENRRLSGLSAMLELLINNQSDSLKKIKSLAESGVKVSPLLVEKQDGLASDVTEFIKACRRESNLARGSEPAFADTLDSMASEAEKRAIRNDMLLASEQLERNVPAEAIPFASKALDGLHFLRDLLEGVRVQQHEETALTMSEALEQAKQKVDRARDLHQRLLESMEAMRGQADKDDVPFDMFLEEYKEITKNTKEALLTVPTDLHVFTEMNAANELIEDVFSVFQEVEQKIGTENLTANDIIEFAYAKEQQLVDCMAEILKEADDMEKWLSDTPDPNKVTTEAFDREELPESGMAMGPLAAQVEDLIGELLEESEEMAEAAEDGATSHALPDTEAGWDAIEGDITSFSADGVSGNQMPDHKEQDGRSIVGREGMSVGETAAGGGTLSEGDKNIEARRTEEAAQSGQVDIDGEGDTAATGGGKQATGKADEYGMTGGGKRMDSTEQGSWEGMASLMALRADAIHAQASLHNVKVGSLKEAAHHLRQSADAIAKGKIEEVKEFRSMALSELQNAKVELEAAPIGSLDILETPRIVESFTGSGSDLAPQKYRQAVADYYKLLNESF